MAERLGMEHFRKCACLSFVQQFLCPARNRCQCTIGLQMACAGRVSRSCSKQTMHSLTPWPYQPGLPQSFGWAVEHDAFHARVGSIPAVFEAAAEDMGQSKVTAGVVRAVWNKLLPGLLQVRCAMAVMLCAQGYLQLPV